jgi:triacylglycerol lipase
MLSRGGGLAFCLVRRLPLPAPVRLLLQAVALLVGIVAAVAVLARVIGGAPELPPAARAPQEVPGPVLLVPGYGGSTSGLEVLAAALRAQGREAVVVASPGDGTGDLRATAQAVSAVVDTALAGGAASVDLVGYSAGGVVARLVVRERPGDVRRVVTLGSPHHGTELAAIGAAFSPGRCPLACQQLVPGSDLLDQLNDGDETPAGPQWLALWTTQDDVVTPPESARLDGAVNVALQELCPGLQVTHAQLPTVAAVTRLVAQAVSSRPVAEPAACPTS